MGGLRMDEASSSMSSGMYLEQRSMLAACQESETADQERCISSRKIASFNDNSIENPLQSRVQYH